MKPVMQTITVDQITGYWDFVKRSVPGNCFQACVASIMEMPIEAVPHFMLFDPWVDAFYAWMKQMGYQVDFTVDADEVPKDTFYILSGRSPRGNFDHAVVAFNGETVHDPHPAGGGVLSFTDAIWAKRIEEAD